MKESDIGKIRIIRKELMGTYDKLIARTGDGFFMYRGGQTALFMGDKVKAADYFARAYNSAPEGSHYKNAAKILSEKLKQ
jgi:hypothetical protein